MAKNMHTHYMPPNTKEQNFHKNTYNKIKEAVYSVFTNFYEMSKN